MKKMIYQKGENVLLNSDGFIEKSDLNTCIALSEEALYDYMMEVNHYVYKLYEQVKVSSNDYIGCFFISCNNRIHKNFQSSLILLSRGLEEPARILIRTMLETVVIAQAIFNDPKNYAKWESNQKIESNRLIDDINRKKKGLAQLKGKVSTEKLYPNQMKTHISDWARLADMEEEYNTAYRVLSGNVHFSYRSYEQDFCCENEKIVAINIGPKMENQHVIITTMLDIMLRTIRIFRTYFQIEDTEFENIDLQLEMFQEKVLTEKNLNIKSTSTSKY